MQKWRVFRTCELNELRVYRAKSSKTEIRFYINENQYVKAQKEEDGTFKVEIEETTNNNKPKAKNQIKMKLERFLILTVTTILLYALLTLISHYIDISLNEISCLLIANILLYVIFIICIASKEKKRATASSRSKHSAEHMLANFLEKNRRLPRSIKEVKESSRFAKKCGTRYNIIPYTRIFIQGIIISLLVVAIATVVLPKEFHNTRIEHEFIAVLYLVLNFIVELFEIYQKVDFLAMPISKWVSIPIQCINTTRYVKRNDIRLAYYAAREWLKIVYPEYYRDGNDSNPFF